MTDTPSSVPNALTFVSIWLARRFGAVQPFDFTGRKFSWTVPGGPSNPAILIEVEDAALERGEAFIVRWLEGMAASTATAAGPALHYYVTGDGDLISCEPGRLEFQDTTRRIVAERRDGPPVRWWVAVNGEPARNAFEASALDDPGRVRERALSFLAKPG